MTKPIAVFLLLFPFLSSAQEITPVPLKNVHTTRGFWHDRVTLAAETTVPHALHQCEISHRIDNFAVAGGLKKGKFDGVRFNDSDVFKVVEGAAYVLQNKYDPKLDHYLDSLITLFAAAQEPNGYLYTVRTINKDTTGSYDWIAGPSPYSFENGSHELYNAGHLYEAAVAHYEATGKRNLLDIAIKNADHLVKTIGPKPGQMLVVPGHEEIELALVRLYRVTGKKEYLDLTDFFISMRGRSDKRTLFLDEHKLGPAYFQDQVPFVRQKEAEGHAVRAQYLYTGVADLLPLRDNPGNRRALDHIWEDATYKKQYVTGGMGAREDGEAFDKAYILPNDNAYAETCAAIANLNWNHSMFLLTGDAKYMDVFERTLYNGFLGGMSVKGNEFFYVNPMSSNGKNDFGKGTGAARSEWFGTACCPTNVSRLLPSVPAYMYATRGNEIFVNLFAGSEATVSSGGTKVTLAQQTSYPWEGTVRMTVSPEKALKFPLSIRIPGWARGEAIPGDLYVYTNKNAKPVTLTINGKSAPAVITDGYVKLDRQWKKGDVIELSMDMLVRTIVSRAEVKANEGKLAVERGPVLYCAEGHDNQGKALNVSIRQEQDFVVQYKKEMLGGINVLTSGPLTLIPYYAWANRGPNEMSVWLNREK
ncbi:glycoside hydrolase family 127 protein [Dyadobacter sandarakinus]|uniref:Glycoside hydrolase family 127 protein n=1 Tax=Dyadobacter sandarakinus TaxID=2747268 RepID=A0ABX7I7R7_9BACT|nr:beta-L-arabinofuranosidase domain-containing protein [Dyadobacter sandarakinus]QRR01883.1 glycoside hydrolase family 127 protein [Dyadobacter sandarakinus]